MPTIRPCSIPLHSMLDKLQADYKDCFEVSIPKKPVPVRSLANAFFTSTAMQPELCVLWTARQFYTPTPLDTNLGSYGYGIFQVAQESNTELFVGCWSVLAHGCT